jgi:hypothetical protein
MSGTRLGIESYYCTAKNLARRAQSNHFPFLPSDVFFIRNLKRAWKLEACKMETAER